VRKPRLTRVRLRRLPVNKPAPTTRSRESATCNTTRPLRKRAETPAAAMFDAWFFKAAAKSGRVAWSAGTNAKSNPLASESANVKPSNGKLSRPSSQGPPKSLGNKRSRPAALPLAIRTPSAPPASATIRPSIRSCLTSDPRPAPRASRMAISRCRPAPRASMRLATLAQAISSTRPTMAMRTSSGLPNFSPRALMPCAAGLSCAR
jgi:hypothetical protein